MYHLIFNFFGIGDQVCLTAIPENIFNSTGKKCVISDKRIWAFKYNPYVIFLPENKCQDYTKLNLIPDCRIPEQIEHYFKKNNSIISNSQTEYVCSYLGIDNVKLRHPRLYINEDIKINKNKIVVHTTGSDRSKFGEIPIRYNSGEDSTRVISDEIIAAILNNYKDYEIVQVGSKNDKLLGGHSINMLGLDIWKTIKEISSCSKFIGVNSGPMHIANCYPKIEKRIVLQEFSEKTILTYKPGDIRNWLFSWLDPSYTYFNKYDFDVGYTYSYSKI